MKRIIQNSLLILASIVFVFLLLEIGVRVYTGNYSFKNVLENYLHITMSAYPTEYDETLGWVSKESISEHDVNGTTITVYENGIRSNGNDEVGENSDGEGPILAVGDSYTFGYEVSDNETWPAILERLTGREVVNGGVIAYGMDQSLLRAQQLIEIYDPDILIFSFIPDDIYRCQLSARTGVKKPYFVINKGLLELKNNPVSRPSLTDYGDPGIRRILGYSVFIHYFMMKYGNGMWWLRGDRWENVQVHRNSMGDDIACLIVRELAGIAQKKGIKVYLLAQYGSNRESRGVKRSRKALDCADPRWLTVIDLHKPLLAVRDRDAREYRAFYTRHQHMTFKGNMFVAKKLEAVLNRTGNATLE